MPSHSPPNEVLEAYRNPHPAPLPQPVTVDFRDRMGSEFNRGSIKCQPERRLPERRIYAQRFDFAASQQQKIASRRSFDCARRWRAALAQDDISAERVPPNFLFISKIDSFTERGRGVCRGLSRDNIGREEQVLSG
jgi:hypothetical protein